MRTTTRWGFTVPNLGTDPDDIPSQIGALADAIDSTVAKFMHGTDAARLAISNPPQDLYFFVDSGPTNFCNLFRGKGTAWQRVTVPLAQSADVTTAAFGDTPAVGVSGRFADAAHLHGMPTNPLTPHLSATDPHPQYVIETETGKVFGALLMPDPDSVTGYRWTRDPHDIVALSAGLLPSHSEQQNPVPPTGWNVGNWTDFGSGLWGTLTFVGPSSGLVEVKISANLRNVYSSTASLNVGWRTSAGVCAALNRMGGANTAVESVGVEGGRLFATKSILCGVTAGASATLTPRFLASQVGDASQTYVEHGRLSVHPIA